MAWADIVRSAREMAASSRARRTESQRTGMGYLQGAVDNFGRVVGERNQRQFQRQERLGAEAFQTSERQGAEAATMDLEEMRQEFDQGLANMENEDRDAAREAQIRYQDALIRLEAQRNKMGADNLRAEQENAQREYELDLERLQIDRAHIELGDKLARAESVARINEINANIMTEDDRRELLRAQTAGVKAETKATDAAAAEPGDDLSALEQLSVRINAFAPNIPLGATKEEVARIYELHAVDVAKKMRPPLNETETQELVDAARQMALVAIQQPSTGGGGKPTIEKTLQGEMGEYVPPRGTPEVTLTAGNVMEDVIQQADAQQRDVEQGASMPSQEIEALDPNTMDGQQAISDLVFQEAMKTGRPREQLPTRLKLAQQAVAASDWVQAHTYLREYLEDMEAAAPPTVTVKEKPAFSWNPGNSLRTQ